MKVCSKIVCSFVGGLFLLSVPAVVFAVDPNDKTKTGTPVGTVTVLGKDGKPLTAEQLRQLELSTADAKKYAISANPLPTPTPPPSPIHEVDGSDLIHFPANALDPCGGTGPSGSLEYEACNCLKIPALGGTRCDNLQKYVLCMRDHNHATTAQTYCMCTTGLQTAGCA